ncbi:MAG: hypothetical protein HC896_10885 [Bacteroidales bacterium]|nr:hypothetical protein [Bacteroidales bacterium]
MANVPVGKATGIFPGRVAWAHNKDATNENMTNEPGDYWWDSKNASQDKVNHMMDSAICLLAGTNSVRDAFTKLFEYHNAQRGKPGGYLHGEKS